MRFYFFCLLVVIIIFTVHWSLRSWVTPAIAMFEHRSGYELGGDLYFKFFPARIKNEFVSQGYGVTPFAANLKYPYDWHNGIDVAVDFDTPVLSVTPGQVLLIGNQDSYCYHRGYGKFVLIKNSEDDKILLYAHLGYINVESGQKIKNGSNLGTVGATGFETGPHLHLSVFAPKNFEINDKRGCGPSPMGQDINPFEYLRALK